MELSTNIEDRTIGTEIQGSDTPIIDTIMDFGEFFTTTKRISEIGDDYKKLQSEKEVALSESKTRLGVNLDEIDGDATTKLKGIQSTDSDVARNYSSKIDKAREQGVSDEEILDYIKEYDKPSKPYFKQDGTIDERAREVYLADEKMVKDIESKLGRELEGKELKAVRRSIANSDYNPEDFSLGVRQMLIGASQASMDFVNMIGLGDDATYKKLTDTNMKAIKEIEGAIKDKDFLSKATAGKIVPQLVTLPISAEAKTLAVLSEATLGYASSRGEGNDIDTSLTHGAISGVLTAGLVNLDKVFKGSSETAQMKVYDYWKTQLELPENKLDDIFANYSKTTGADDTIANRTLSLVEYAGKEGASLKRNLVLHDPEVRLAINKQMKDRAYDTIDRLSSTTDTREISTAIREGFESAKNSYNKTKEMLTNSSVNNPSVKIPELVGDITTSRAKIDDVFKVDENGVSNYTVHDLIDVMPDINDMLARSSGTTKHEWGVVKDAINKEIGQNLTNRELAIWNDANMMYNKFKSVSRGKYEETLKKFDDGEIGADKMVQLLADGSNSRATTMENIKYLVGAENSVKIEKAVIDDALGSKHIDNVSLDILANTLKTKGFVNEETRGLTDFIQDVANTFKTDKEYRALIEHEAKDLSGRSSNVFIKMATQVTSEFYNKTFAHLSKSHRMKVSLAEWIKTNPNNLATIKKGMDVKGKGTMLKEMEDLIKTEAPSLKSKAEYKNVTKETPSYGTVTELKTASKLKVDYMTDFAKKVAIANGDDESKVITKLFNNFSSPTLETKASDLMSRVVRGTLTEDKALQSFVSKYFDRSLGLDVTQFKDVSNHYLGNIKANLDIRVDLPETVASNSLPIKSFISSKVNNEIYTSNDTKKEENMSIGKKSTNRDNIIKHESGGDYNAKNPSSSAYGKYQVIGSTNRWVSGKLGITEEFSKTPKGQELVMDYLMGTYERLLTRLDKPVNEANTYTVHQLGSGRATRFFSGKLNSKDIKVLKANIPKKYHKDLKDRQDIIDKWSELYRS